MIGVASHAGPAVPRAATSRRSTHLIVDPFRAPACAFCAGNRGLEYQPHAGSAGRRRRAGVVTFSGVVAGVRYLVVDQTDGRSATYGRLAVARVARRGDGAIR